MTLRRRKQNSGAGVQTRLKAQLKEREDGPAVVVNVTATAMSRLLGRADPPPAQTLLPPRRVGAELSLSLVIKAASPEVETPFY